MAIPRRQRNWIMVVFLMLSVLATNACDESAHPQERGSKSKTEASRQTNQSKRNAPKPHSRTDTARALIPKGRVDVQILELGAPPRAHELMKKMMAGMSSNSEWYANFVREHAQPGEPLPYDARMGITKEEYDEFLGLNNQLTTVEVGRALLDCKEIAEGRFEFQGGTGLEVLKGIQIDLIKDVLITTNGIGDNRSEVTASEAQSATGPWNGVQWAVRDFDTATMTGVVEKLALGRLSRTGRYILYYNLAKAGSDESNRSSLILTYDLPSN